MTRPIQLDLTAELCRRSFAEFTERFFPVVTGVPLARNVAIDAKLAVLQAVADGRITGITCICEPPGVAKSTTLALYASWRRARNPGHRSIHASHAFGLASTESRRVRRLVESDEYRALFPRVVLRSDENTAEHWATTLDGRYFACGTDGALTGRRAHEGICDDPLNAPDRFSKAARDSLWAWFTEAFLTRLDGDHAPVVVVQQRLDRDDLVGRLLASGERVTLVELAAEYDPAHHCVVHADDGAVVWEDPRSVDNELLAPTVLPREKLETLKKQIGSSAYATQYGQRATDDSAAVIKRSWWNWHRASHVADNTPRPAGCDTSRPAISTPDSFPRIVVAADLTFGSLKGDYCAVQAWGSLAAGRYLLRRWRKRAGLLESVALLKQWALDFPTALIVIEKAANGAGALEELTAAGVPRVVGRRPLGSKAERIGVVSATIESGCCFLPLGLPGIGDFVEELAGATKHDDEQDAAAYAIHELNRAELMTMTIGMPPILMQRRAHDWGDR